MRAKPSPTRNAPFQLLAGDCITRLAELPDNSVDALVTDPPYGLSKEPDIAKVMQHWLDDRDYMHTAKGFMGKTWDSFVPGPKYWREVFRVLKPGAHGLVFAGTRTQDLMAIALRFAGFEIRDTFAWVYGSGFPKSLDVSKAIDKANGDAGKRPIKCPNPARRPNAYVGQNGWQTPKRPMYKTSAASAASAAWEGWGTALKPAIEPIILVRKPLGERTVAANVLKWGTGGLNIDGCRVELRLATGDARISKTGMGFWNAGKQRARETGEERHNAAGRFPANLVLDEAAAAALDAQSGTLKTGGPKSHPTKPGSFGGGGGNTQSSYTGGTGGASRFFYVAKPSRRERNAGLEGMPNQLKMNPMRSANGTGKKNFEGGFPDTRMQNHHPTVKPIALMRYLCRLITPPAGLVLDPFTGSGTTGVAALEEGFRFIGVEREKDYLKIAKLRIRRARGRA